MRQRIMLTSLCPSPLEGYIFRGGIPGCKVVCVFVCECMLSRSVISDSLQPHELQHTRPPCPLPTPRVYSNSCPLSWWSHTTISSSVVPFFSCLQSFTTSGSFPKTQFFTSGSQSIGVSASASVLPMNIHNWFPLGWTDWRRQWQPTPVFLPGEFQGRRSLVGCRLWGHTESDTTEVT